MILREKLTLFWSAVRFYILMRFCDEQVVLQGKSVRLLQDLLIIIGKNLMLKQQSACSLCQSPFTSIRHPRLMPLCTHSACSDCLKQQLAAQPTAIICTLCKTEFPLPSDPSLELFPKNIALIRFLKEKSASDLSLKGEKSSRDTQDDSGSGLADNHFCQTHKKQMEIICLSDRVRVCPHCALFGPHRDHPLRTVTETIAALSHQKEQYQSLHQRKQQLDVKLGSVQFREQMVGKISAHKTRLVAEVKRKFSQLHQNLKLAQKRAFEEVAKRLKTIAAQVSQVARQDHQCQKQFQVWEGQSQQMIEAIQRCKRIEDKAQLFFGGKMSVSKQGEAIIREMQRKIEQNAATIDAIISRIKVVENPAVPISLFNYVNIVIEDEEQLEAMGHIVQETITPKLQMKQQQRRPEFSPDYQIREGSSQNMIRQPSSPLRSAKKNTSWKQINKSRMVNRSLTIQSQSEPPCMQKVVADFIENQQLDTLDLTNQSLLDVEIYEILQLARAAKKIKCLKLGRNKMTTEGLAKVLEFLPAVTNLNLSFNQLTDDAITQLLNNRHKVPQLRIVNLSNNRINQRRVKTAIDELKRMGLIATI